MYNIVVLFARPCVLFSLLSYRENPLQSWRPNRVALFGTLLRVSAVKTHKKYLL